MPSDGSPSSTIRVGDYRILSHLGSGTSGEVYRARARGDTTDVAIKIIPAFRVGPPVRREVQIHHSLSHRNIAQLLHVLDVPTPGASGNMPLALVTELCVKGDLFEELAVNGVLPPCVARRRMRDIARALHHLHSLGYVHGDLKLENVAVDAAGVAKLIDFGCARRIAGPHDPSSSFDSFGGTVQYLAPESVPAPGRSTAAPPSVASDLWALGVLLYTCMAGAYPFDGHSAAAMSDAEVEKRTRYNIVRAPPAPVHPAISVPRDLQQIIDGLLQKDPAKRMTLDEVIAALAPTHMPRYQYGQWPTAVQKEAGGDGNYVEQGRKRQTAAEVMAVVDRVRLQRMSKFMDHAPIFSNKTSPTRQNVVS